MLFVLCHAVALVAIALGVGANPSLAIAQEPGLSERPQPPGGLVERDVAGALGSRLQLMEEREEREWTRLLRKYEEEGARRATRPDGMPLPRPLDDAEMRAVLDDLNVQHDPAGIR